MTEESSSPGGWVSIGHLIGEMPWKTYSANAVVYFRPLATPGEIENCARCVRHVNDPDVCQYPYDLEHMRAIHAFHTRPATGPDGVPPTQRSQSRQE